MAHENVRVRERYELTLDGRQIASIVAGSLVALGLVFALGLRAGERVGSRRAEAARPASLVDLDAAAARPAPPSDRDLTFPAELPRAKPPAPPPPAAPRPAPAAAANPPPPEPSPLAAAAPAQPAPADPSPDAEAATPLARAFTVQLGAAQRREEAEILARKVQALSPRIEEAEVPGKGHFFRVRVGRFTTKAAADKYRADVIRETGIAGVVIPPGS
ncbi:MAG TPA: SPOR domain-containing protein [Anaeromyxobacter sp.]|nr:SPOR domain-containing protein [Anaeromyxobacter sp.]